MKQFRVKLKKTGSGFLIKLPKMITDRFHFRDGDEIEINILAASGSEQGNLWEPLPEDIREITFNLSGETHSMNMYNRIYIPARFRFFFPPARTDFILSTNIGKISTHLTSDGFLKKNIMHWFSYNGPLDSGDQLNFIEEEGAALNYRLHFKKSDQNEIEKIPLEEL